ncbi:hypothetical protein D3C72_1238590 [compost metagenome]
MLATALVGGAAGQGLQRRAEGVVIVVVADLVGRIDVAPEHGARLVIAAKARHDGKDREGVGVVLGHQVQLDQLDAFLEVGQHHARTGLAGEYRVAEGQSAEPLGGFAPRFAGSIGGKDIGGFGAGEEAGVQSYVHEPDRAICLIADLHPYGLHAPLRQWYAVERFAFRRGEDRDRHVDAAIRT